MANETGAARMSRMKRTPYLDMDGIDRVPSILYGVNMFTTANGAERSAIGALNRGVGYYIWRTDEGLYEWTAIPETRVARAWPFVLVSHNHTPAGAKWAKWSRANCAECQDEQDVRVAGRWVVGEEHTQ